MSFMGDEREDREDDQEELTCTATECTSSQKGGHEPIKVLGTNLALWSVLIKQWGGEDEEKTKRFPHRAHPGLNIEPLGGGNRPYQRELKEKAQRS